MSKDNGGPAFPGKEVFRYLSNSYGEEPIPEYRPVSGMSLRDYFAGQAMSAMIGVVVTGNLKPEADANGEIGPSLARGAYAVADAMLAERTK